MSSSPLIARWRDGYESEAERLTSTPLRVNPAFSQALLQGIALSHASDRELRGLAQLHSLALLEWSVGTDLVAQPLSRELPLPTWHEMPSVLGLSTWVMLRPTSDSWVLESAAVPWQVRVGHGLAARISESRWSDDEWTLLTIIGMTRASDDPVLAQSWSFHDRLFAMRSRGDAVSEPSPMMRGDASPPPLHRVPEAATRSARGRIALRPVAGPRVDEPSLFEVMESRTTIRHFSDSPVELDDLAELLWRSVRLRERSTGKMPGLAPYEAARGPAPSGGGLHAIDTWVATPRVRELPSAWWWYDPLAHDLAHVRDLEPSARNIPLAFRFTVRHARTSWKYPGIAHALELKDMGAIMMAMQLAAAPLDLGVWLLGSGSTSTFAEDLGVDPTVDHPIGEVLAGYRCSSA